MKQTAMLIFWVVKRESQMSFVHGMISPWSLRVMQLTELFLCPMDGNRALKDKGVSSPLTDRLFVCYFFYFIFLTEKSLGEEKLSHIRAKTSRKFQRGLTLDS